MKAGWWAIAALGGAVALRVPLGEANAARRELELPSLPPKEVAQILAFGHRSTLADSLWLRAVPDLARRFARADEPEDLARQRKDRWLSEVVEVISELEPTFQTVYSYGSAYFQLVTRNLDRAVEVLELGVEKSPDDLFLKVNLGMALLTLKKDSDRALQVFQEVVDHPGCDPLSLGLCAKLMVDRGEDVAALEQYRRFLESEDEYTRKMAELFSERTRRNLFVRAWREYESENGSSAESIEELRAAGLIAEGVADEVLGAARLVDGVLSFPRLTELELEHLVNGVRNWSHNFRTENGTWPTLEDLREYGQFALPRLPPGQSIELVEGELRVNGAASSGTGSIP